MKGLKFLLPLLIIVNFMETAWAEDNVDVVAMKRPFCNAFTGCGRKRDPAYSSPAIGPQPQQYLPADNAGLYQVLRILAARALRSEEARMRQRSGPGGPLGDLEQPHLVLF